MINAIRAMKITMLPAMIPPRAPDERLRLLVEDELVVVCVPVGELEAEGVIVIDAERRPIKKQVRLDRPHTKIKDSTKHSSGN